MTPVTASLLALLAAVPPPSPPVAVTVHTGQSGEWFGPIIVLVTALILDWSALGPVSPRDRLACAGYYSSGLSVISIFGWASVIQSWFTSWSWQLGGSAVAFLAHLGLVLAFFGTRLKPVSGIATKVMEFIHLEHKDSSANRINTTLMTWSFLAAASSVLARGPLSWFTVGVAHGLTGLWSWLGNILVSGLGG